MLNVETINTHEAVDLFLQLMQPTSDIRILHLLGDGKMGKSHLLTKVFPSFARRYQVHCAILDLRNQMYAVPDILHLACSYFPPANFGGYYAAHDKWIIQPKVKVENVLAIGSRLDFSAKDIPNATLDRDRLLTTQFVNDLRKLDVRTLLLFDSFNHASENVQAWLMHMLLPQLSSLDLVRVVVAGRSLPEANGSYTNRCRSYQLKPVTDEDAYIPYCRNLKVTLGEEAIRVLAKAFDYNPGLFAEIVCLKFAPQKIF